ncbi:MAG: O-methyltransferase [Defluviitaleaceae bacterium]|nr:O-methyltransferase [Defluviitaleaceae bacterium]
MSITNENIENYIDEIQPLCTGILGEIQQEAMHAGLPIIPPQVARFLSTLLSIHRPANILEIGCAVGFSAALMSQYLPEGGRITTIDRYDIMISRAKENFRKLGIEDKITLLEGDARDILPTLNGSYDFIFLDAAKGQYHIFFAECMRLLHTGGVLLADNILQGGRTAAGRYEIEKRQRTTHTRMNALLREVSNMPELETSIIPIGDGLLLVCKTAAYAPQQSSEETNT